MRSSTKLILLILSTITLVLVTECQRTIQTEKKELEKLLNHVNKPAIKSFQTEDGYILDCIDIRKQLAFDHPLLKNHSIQLKPSTIPKWSTTYNKNSQNSGSLPFRQDDITCPLGTVIVKRTTLEDLLQNQHSKPLGPYYATSKDKNVDLAGHHFSFASYKGDNYGGKGNINIWDPQVSSDQFSLASMYVVRGVNSNLQSIAAGWIVNQGLHRNHSQLFTYWTADGYNKTGCYNTVCPGFVQVSRKFALGALAKPVSTYGGQQYNLEVNIFQDRVTTDWWFVLKDERIGYWPRSLFNVEGLAIGARQVFWGGEVFSPMQVMSPNMGSGHFPREGYKKAAYINGLEVIDHGTGKVKTPSGLQLFTDSPSCYNVENDKGDIYYGGPGGAIG